MIPREDDQFVIGHRWAYINTISLLDSTPCYFNLIALPYNLTERENKLVIVIKLMNFLLKNSTNKVVLFLNYLVSFL